MCSLISFAKFCFGRFNNYVIVRVDRLIDWLIKLNAVL